MGGAVVSVYPVLVGPALLFYVAVPYVVMFLADSDCTLDVVVADHVVT
jgi:hypothetical protein